MTPDANALVALCREAGRAILEVRARGIDVERKDDHSPVTQADRAAEAIILARLRRDHPDIPIVAEEEASEGLAPERVGSRFFLVDPLDGTKEFVRGGTDFTVNVALVEDGQPRFGIVHVPATDVTYLGTVGEGARRIEGSTSRAISCRAPATPLAVVASKSHRTAETDAWIAALEARHGTCETVSVGSSLKFCLLAEGLADLYPRFGRTMEWDTAAGDAVLRAAGGMTFHTDGLPFAYGKRANWNGEGDVAFANPHFIASASGAFPA